jgi:hypothetical protein
MGCNAVEDMHHIFIDCTAFTKLRENAKEEVVKKTKSHIQAVQIEETRVSGLLWRAKSLFINCRLTWPLHYFFYYLSHVPQLDRLVPIETFKNHIQHDHFIHGIHGDWHMSSIRLASHIYGQMQREMARRHDAHKEPAV